VLTWAPKMESDLLLHLKRHLRTPSNPQLVLDEIDHYCSTSRWMMHCGPYKGDIIEAEVKKSNKKTCLELGTYCGYASIRIARSMDEMGTLYTIEEKQEIADIAKEIIRMTGLAKVKQIVGMKLAL
jgi:catechol O-methyltransferase